MIIEAWQEMHENLVSSDSSDNDSCSWESEAEVCIFIYLIDWFKEIAALKLSDIKENESGSVTKKITHSSGSGVVEPKKEKKVAYSVASRYKQIYRLTYFEQWQECYIFSSGDSLMSLKKLAIKFLSAPHH